MVSTERKRGLYTIVRALERKLRNLSQIKHIMDEDIKNFLNDEMLKAR